MGGFMTYLNKVQSGNIEEVEEDVIEVVVEKVKPKVKPQPIKKPITPQKIDASVSIIEERIKSKLDEVGLNSKLISEVVSFVLSDVKNVKDLKVTNSPNTSTQKKPNINEFAYSNDIAGVASHILEGVRDVSGNTNTVNNEQNNFAGVGYASNIADHASSLLL